MLSLTTGPVTTYWARNGALVFRLLLARFNLGVWLEGSSPIGRLSLGIPRRISSHCDYEQVRL